MVNLRLSHGWRIFGIVGDGERATMIWSEEEERPTRAWSHDKESLGRRDAERKKGGRRKLHGACFDGAIMTGTGT